MFQVLGPKRKQPWSLNSCALLPELPQPPRPLALETTLRLESIWRKKHTRRDASELSFGPLKKPPNVFDSWSAFFSQDTTPFFGSWDWFFRIPVRKQGIQKSIPSAIQWRFYYLYFCDKSWIAKQPTKQWTPHRATKDVSTTLYGGARIFRHRIYGQNFPNNA